MNEKPSLKLLFRIKLTIKDMTKNNENVKKKERISVTLRSRTGWT
jgi:hypothetical protein